tara:strand:+ start:11347 stop:12042 length:696 start_codon:yes stop_codon:yes gene_type:complete
MNKIKFVAISLIAFLTFSSCSSDEVLSPEEISEQLFKTYQLKRDINGAYSLDIIVEDNISITKVKNPTNNTNQFHLLSSNSKVAQKSYYGSDLWFDNDNFRIEFISENFNKTPSISIIDDNIKYNKKGDEEFLKEYSITKNEEGSYDLDFKVINNVGVDFVYDSENNVYEIHLELDVNTEGNNTYSRTFEKADDELLQIHFVNHITGSAKGQVPITERRPVIIIDEGENGE